MSKIRVTENELKQLIRESVEGVLNEALWDTGQSFGSNLRNLPGRLTGLRKTVGNNFLDAAQGVARGTAGNTTGMQGDINQISNRSKYATSSRDDLIGQIVQRDRQITDLNNQVSTLSGQVATLTADNTTLSGQVATLTAEVDKWKGSYSKLKSTNAELTKANQSLTTRLQNANNQITKPNVAINNPGLATATPTSISRT